MYTYTGYLFDTDLEVADTKLPLLVTCCGIYRLLTRKSYSTARPNGRKDYQLLYVHSGRAFFYCKGQTLEASAGDMVLYRPGEEQRYRYFLADSPEICWIHFAGKEAEALLEEIGFSGISLLSCGTAPNYYDIFRQIIRELLMKRPCHGELSTLLLRQLFAAIHRYRLEADSGQSRYEEMDEAVRYFNEYFSRDINIREYAESLPMSVCWFIRSFKRCMGMTPLQYIASIRINKAKELLKNTDYTVQEIGAIVGYENPLYFSRIFKKAEGMPPSRYRSGRVSAVMDPVEAENRLRQ